VIRGKLRRIVRGGSAEHRPTSANRPTAEQTAVPLGRQNLGIAFQLVDLTCLDYCGKVVQARQDIARRFREGKITLTGGAGRVTPRGNDRRAARLDKPLERWRDQERTDLDH